MQLVPRGWALTLAPVARAVSWGVTPRHPGLGWRTERAQLIMSVCSKTLTEQMGEEPAVKAPGPERWTATEFPTSLLN